MKFGFVILSDLIYKNFKQKQIRRRGSRGFVVKVRDCDIVVTEFELLSQDCFHFRTVSLGKGMNL